MKSPTETIFPDTFSYSVRDGFPFACRTLFLRHPLLMGQLPPGPFCFSSFSSEDPSQFFLFQNLAVKRHPYHTSVCDVPGPSSFVLGFASAGTVFFFFPPSGSSQRVRKNSSVYRCFAALSVDTRAPFLPPKFLLFSARETLSFSYLLQYPPRAASLIF